MDEDVDAIAKLARRQRGYVTRRQLLALGLGAHAIDYRARIGRLIVAYAGVYAVGHLPTSAVDRAAGAVLACGRDAVLSHGSAAALWGFKKSWEMPFELTAPTDHERPGIHVHRSTALARQDLRQQLGLRVTSPARTILDIAPRLGDAALNRTVNDSRIAGLLHLDSLADVAARFPRHPGARRLRLFTQSRRGPTRSQLEDAFIAFAETYELPIPQVNTHVAGYEVDALFEAEGLIVEIDGYDSHSSRLAFASDRDRDTDTLDHGLETVRLTSDRIKMTPRKEADRLHRILERRRQERGDG